jgi:hypothetical protein
MLNRRRTLLLLVLLPFLMAESVSSWAQVLTERPVERPPLHEALRPIQDCADAGDARCQYWLGELFLGRLSHGMPHAEEVNEVELVISHEAAFEEHLKAASQRHLNAMFIVARMLCEEDVRPHTRRQNAFDGLVFAFLSTSFRRSSKRFEDLLEDCTALSPDLDAERAMGAAIVIHHDLYGHPPILDSD